MAFQFRRGTDAERQSITPKAGEPIFVTDTGKLYVGYTDPETNSLVQGGLLVSTALSDDETPSLSGNLNLNDNDIVGTGNINIDGFITATGNINLGDGAEDNIIIGGVIGSSLIPDTDGLYDLGADNFFWRSGYFEDVTVDGELKANSLQIKSIELDDSTTVYDAETQSLFVESIDTQTVTGDLTGSVFSDDSTFTLVDAVNNAFNTSELNIQFNTITSPVNLTVEATNVTLRGSAVDGGIENAANFIARSAKLDNETSVEPVPGDYIGGVAILSEFNNDFDTKSIFITSIDSVTGSATSPAKKELWLNNAEGTLEKMLTVNSKGVTESTGPFKMPSYANDSDRDAKITNAEAGMVIFNRRDDSTGVPQFQGYDGTIWVDLH